MVIIRLVFSITIPTKGRKERKKEGRKERI
jgi:hypothetical protein